MSKTARVPSSRTRHATPLLFELLHHIREAVLAGHSSLDARSLHAAVKGLSGVDDGVFAAAIRQLVDDNIVVPKSRDGDWFLDVTLRAAHRFLEDADPPTR